MTPHLRGLTCTRRVCITLSAWCVQRSVDTGGGGSVGGAGGGSARRSTTPRDSSGSGASGAARAPAGHRPPSRGSTGAPTHGRTPSAVSAASTPAGTASAAGTAAARATSRRRTSVKLQTTSDGVVVAAGLSLHTVSTMPELLRALDAGSAQRARGHHNLNVSSSRSHLVQTVVVTASSALDGSETVARLTLVDLAGSERIKKSGSTGAMLEESKSINKTLTALGNVMESLARQAAHIPFRCCAVMAPSSARV